MKTTEKMVQEVKDCAQSIMDNAESIVGDYKYQTSLDISVRISVMNDAPEISVCTDFIPEAFGKAHIV